MELSAVCKALGKNNMAAHAVKDRNEARKLAMSMIREGDVVGTGGSITLDQCGIRDELRSGSYKHLDWWQKKLSPEEKNRILRDTLTCDVFLTGSNAITKDGKLYNVDGRGNRVAALIFGPKKVIVVAGRNKIVKDLTEARERIETIAGPKNAERLQKKTGCRATGYCVDCAMPERICCHTVISEQQSQKRITVILVDEDLGI
jgi:hypothetical protein